MAATMEATTITAAATPRTTRTRRSLSINLTIHQRFTAGPRRHRSQASDQPSFPCGRLHARPDELNGSHSSSAEDFKLGRPRSIDGRGRPSEFGVPGADVRGHPQANADRRARRCQ